MWQIVRDLVAEGTTIFLTTQYLEEADELADRIAVLDHGRIVAEGTPTELKRMIPGGHILLRFPDLDQLGRAVHAMRALGDVRPDHDALTVRIPGDGDVRTLRAILDRLDAESIHAEQLSIHTPDLDDVFLTLTGHPSDRPSTTGSDATREGASPR